MGPDVPFSSPPLRLYARTAGLEIGDDWPSWAAPALWNTAPGSSPFKAVDSLVKYREELTRSSERVLKQSALALVTDGNIPWLMDVDEARSALKTVAAKVETRAAKRSAEAEAAAEAERRSTCFQPCTLMHAPHSLHPMFRIMLTCGRSILVHTPQGEIAASLHKSARNQSESLYNWYVEAEFVGGEVRFSNRALHGPCGSALLARL